MKKWTKWKIFKTVWAGLAVVFLVWMWTTFQSRNLPEGTFENSDLVSVTKSRDFITFRSDTAGNDLNVIFFQGALTDHKAYAPLCRELAENGFTCHLMKMKWRQAQYDYKKTLRLFDLDKGNYVGGGHSQGGKIAARIVYENPTLFKGLFLLGTSHPRDIDMSALAIPTIKIYAEQDGIASVQEVMANESKLPVNSKLVLISGGNHSQFGYLGRLLMDDKPGISLEEQQQQTLVNLVEFFSGIMPLDM